MRNLDRRLAALEVTGRGKAVRDMTDAELIAIIAPGRSEISDAELAEIVAGLEVKHEND